MRSREVARPSARPGRARWRRPPGRRGRRAGRPARSSRSSWCPGGGEVAPAGRQEARDRAGVGERGVVARSLGQRHGLVGEPAGALGVALPVGGDGQIGGEAGSLDERAVVAQGGERLVVVLLGRRPLAAPLVDATELALDAGDVVARRREPRPARSWPRRRRSDRRASRGRRSPRGARRRRGAPGPAPRRSASGRRRWRTPPGRGRRPGGSARRRGRRGRPAARGAPPRPRPTPPVDAGPDAASSASATRWCRSRRRASDVWSYTS